MLCHAVPCVLCFAAAALQTVGFSAVLNFTAPPAAGSDAPVNILLVADSGHWSPDNAYSTSGTTYGFYEQIPWWAAVPGVGECAAAAAACFIHVARKAL
jgi:hypothetical protein